MTHTASLTGRVAFPPAREVKLLHYKNLGLDYFVARTSGCGNERPPWIEKKVGGFISIDRRSNCEGIWSKC